MPKAEISPATISRTKMSMLDLFFQQACADEIENHPNEEQREVTRES